MTTRTWLAVALLPALLMGGAVALAQATDDEHQVHHPDDPAAAEAAPDQPGGMGMMGSGMMGMMGQGMMGGEAPQGGPGGMMGMMGPGRMGHGMMHHPGVVVIPPVVVMPGHPGGMGMGGHGMMPGMMGPGGMMGQGMMAPPGEESEEGMMPPGPGAPGMMGRSPMGGGMMGGRGMGPAMLYGAPGELSVERVQAMLEGHLAWHGNPRLKLGEVSEQEDGTIVAEILTVDDSLVQRLAVDPDTGALRQLP